MLTESLVSIRRLSGREALAHSLDLSTGGIRFQAVGLDARVNDILKVTLTLGEVTTTVVGQLVRAKDLDEFTQEVAICFLKMDDQTRRHIESHLPASEPVSDPTDRREFTRMDLDSVVSVSRATVSDVVAQVRDLSLGGIKFLVEGMELDLGDILRVTLELGGGTADVVGQLVRVTEVDDLSQEIALAFLDVDSESHELMQEHLPEHEESEA